MLSRGHAEMKDALRGVLEEMAGKEQELQADLQHKASVILAQRQQISVLDAALQVCSPALAPWQPMHYGDSPAEHDPGGVKGSALV